MRILPRCIEHTLNVTIERPHHAYARKHCWPAQFCGQDQGFHRGLPFRGRVFRLWQLGDVGAGVVQGDEPAAVRQRDRIVEEAPPGQSSILLRDPDRKYAPGNRFCHRLACSAHDSPIPSGLPCCSCYVLMQHERQQRARNHQAVESLAASGKGGPRDDGFAAPDRKGFG